ncbi:MAG: glycosyltransferase [Lachnospiraceae bacterium]|nr:glycosyltransferase [Lachnospiraceae bacterium]
MEKNKKRIMLIVPMLDQGGLERVCAETAQLLKKEYDVHLVVFNTTGMIYDVSGVDMIDLNMGAVEGRIGKAVNVFRRAQRVKKLKKQLGIQLSYSFGPTANLVNVLSKYKDITWAGIRGYGALDSKGSMKLICSLADRVVSCTRVMEQEIAKSFRTKGIATLYNPCDLAGIEQLARQNVSEPFRTFLERPGKTIVSMGRAHDVKGFWHLIKSFYLVKKQVPELKLMIIGDGDYSAYGELAGALGIGDDVLFTGILQNPFPLLARADLYALTSQSEGFPNALIEAMACGIPCISVNCKTGPAEILQDNYTVCADQHKVYHADYGILMPIFQGEKNLEADSFSVEEEIFAQEMEKILTDDVLYLHYREMAVKRAKAFGTEGYLKNLVKMIEEEW